MDKSTLIVGARFGQIPALKLKKKWILHCGLGKNPQAVGSVVADYFYDVDIIDGTEDL